MKKYKIDLFILSSILLFSSQTYAGQEKSSGFFKAHCGADVLKKVFHNLGLNSGKENKVIEELDALADQSKGFNSLYEIKLAAQKADLKTKALKLNLDTLSFLTKGYQVIANITGNRHFCVIKEADGNKISVYIPGLNYNQPCLSRSQFLEYWDNVVLLISKKNIDLRKCKGSYELVSDEQLKKIVGAQSCGNVSGGGGEYSGSGGSDRWSSGNESGESNSDSSNARGDPSTTEPVVIRNGNLFLTVDDTSVPTRNLPLILKRYYNSEVVSEVPGWLPEPGAGSWVIENGEYSAQGNRSTSDLKFQDFTLELDMQTIQSGANYSWETDWINFRYTEDPNDARKPRDCYYFLIHTDGKVELSKWQNGVQYFLYNRYTSFRPTDKNQIKIIASGANIKVYINSSLEIDYIDSSPLLSEGRIALESNFSHSHFDNLNITSGAGTYNYDFNSDDNEFIFGYGWTHSYFLRIKEYTTHVTLYRENNSKEIYVPNGDGTYFSVPVNYYSKLTKDASGFSLKTKYGIHYRFDLSGRLQYIEDRNLNRTTLTYSDINGKTLLTSITEPAGRKITLEYGTNNMVAKATDPQGNFMQYFYDAAGHLTQVIDRESNATNYIYDSITHNLNQLTDPAGNIYKYHYTYNDRVNDQTDPQGNTTTFDYLWSDVHVINKRGEIYKYNFDNHEFLQDIIDPNNVLERTYNDENGNITNYYDKNGNHTYFTYDANGNRTGSYDAQGNWTTFTYETTYNQPTSFTDARANVTTFSYDTKGNLTQTINPEGGVTTNTYNIYGQVTLITDPKGNITQFTYDSYGNLATKTDAQGNTATYIYDILGRLTKVTDPLGNSSEYTYDKNGKLLSVKDPLNNITTYTYTKNGELASATDPLGNTTQYTYDCFGNLLNVTDVQGNITTYTYDTTNQMHLNKANLLTIRDAKCNVTTYAYDSLDRLIQSTDVAGRFYQFSYDPQGNLISRTDANGKTITYQFDALNRLYRINYPDASSVDYTYDTVGNVTQMQDGGGLTAYSYDQLNRLKSQIYPDATALNYTYDLNGNRTILEVTGFGRILYDYDNLNRFIKITSPDTKTTQFAYDKLSRRTQLNYPNGAISTYTYDNTSRLSQLINKDKSSLDISKFIYTYDKASRRTNVALINGSINYTYDKLNQLLSESGTVEAKSFSTTYTYDKVGNRLTSLEDGSTTNYTYNNLNQLTQSQSSGATQKLIPVQGNVSDVNPITVKVNGIDAIVSTGQFTANNIPLTPGVNTIKAEATDSAGNIGTHQISVTYNPSGVTIDYTYDKNGNLIQRITGATTETFSYDTENRLKTYTSPTQNASYTYNGQGKRISKTISGITTQYYYDGDELMLEKTGASSIYYIHGPKIDEIISDTRGYCYHTDGLGSAVNLTNSSGAKVNSYNYKAFGSIRSQSGSVANQWLFTGRQFDTESGLYFYRNRYYSPSIGRFTTQDPSLRLSSNLNIPYNLQNNLPLPLKLNPLIYVENNPVNLIDPFGLEAIPVPWYQDPVTWVVFTATLGPKVIDLVKNNVSIEGPSVSGRIFQIRFGENIVIVRLDYHPLESQGDPILHINVEVVGYNIHIPIDPKLIFGNNE